MEMISTERFKQVTGNFKNVNDILVLGDIGLDNYIFGTVDRISPEAPVPVLRVTKEEKKLGMAANICHNIFSLGGKSSLVSIIGDDPRGQCLRKMMSMEGVELNGLLSIGNVTTISKERVLTERQQICRVDYELEKPNYSKKNLDLVKSSFEKNLDYCEYIIFEDYSKGLFTQSTTPEFIKIAKDANKFIAIDPGRSKPAHHYTGATLLKPNLSEARELVHSLGYSDTNIEDMVNILVDKLDLKMIAITLGSDGMALFDVDNDSRASIIPTLASEVFDVSGAGDTVIGVIMMALSAGASLLEAGLIANIAAGVVVSKSGTATVDIAELTSYYEFIKSKIKYDSQERVGLI